MPYMLVRHKVADFERWKPVYNGHEATRAASGGKGAHLFRNANDPNEVVLLFEWSDLDAARRFTESEDLRDAMQRAGVTERPDIYFLEEVERTPA